MRQYLEQYVEHYGLRPHISYGTEVVKMEQQTLMSATKGAGGDKQGHPNKKRHKLLLCAKTEDGMKNLSEVTVSHLIIATGAADVATVPELLKSFKGKIVHTGDYKHVTDEFPGKQILIVGGGESASQSSSFSLLLSFSCIVFSLLFSSLLISSFLFSSPLLSSPLFFFSALFPSSPLALFPSYALSLSPYPPLPLLAAART